MEKFRTRWALFDLDDTLGGVEIEGEVLGTSSAFFYVIDKFADRMRELGFDGDIARDTLNDIDVALCKKEGFGSKDRFARAMGSAYVHMSGATFQQKVMDEVTKLGMQVFKFPYRPLPGAIDVLAEVSKTFKVAIVTKGEDGEQRKKVFDMGLWPYADQVIPLPHKNKEEWMMVLHSLRILTPEQKREAWAVGNSVKSDLNPLLEEGINGLHLTTYNTWAFEDSTYAEPTNGARLVVTNDIRDVIKHVY
jgi:putative hydrolase of the HAD superfamily